VHEAKDKQKIEKGNVYIAPGDKHLEIKLDRLGEGFICSLQEGERVSGHKPSVDVLFESFAKNVGKRAVGVMLTGMGRDGAKGMLMMKQAGAFNIGQDEQSCVVYGMPKAAYLAGAVDVQLPLHKMVQTMMEYMH
jgi:two-component system chemotaxis response regulator CheB